MQKIKKVFGVLLAITLLVNIGSVALAQGEPVPTLFEGNEEVTAEDLGIDEPTLLPDSKFYFLKNWGRSIRSFFTFDKVKKVELKLKYASEQLLETDLMLKKNKKPELLEKAIAKYEASIESVRKAASAIKGTASSSTKVGTFLDKLNKQSILHQLILTKLENQVPTSIVARIRVTREVHIQKFGEVINKLEDRAIKVKKRVEKKNQGNKGNSSSTDVDDENDNNDNSTSSDETNSTSSNVSNNSNKDGTKWIRLDAIDVQAVPAN